MSSMTKCCKCNKATGESSTFISMLLSMEAGNEEKFDLKEALQTFFEHSKLEEDDWMYCDTCDCKTETETWSEIAHYPCVLTLHLKRFDFDHTMMGFQKNERCLDVPLTLPKKGNRPKYDLHAVINHKGGFGGGHYDAIIRSFENGLWYRFDDSIVMQTSEAKLENSSLPYMLMYRKAAALSPENVPHPMRILAVGRSRAGKSTVGNILLGGNYFPCDSGSVTVTKESMVKTVGKVTVVDTPNLFSFDKPSWDNEFKKCVKLCDPGPNVILWVEPISEFSELKQGPFNSLIRRLDPETTKNRMIIVFINGDKLKKLGQRIDTFISKRRKLRKVVQLCQNRYHVIDPTDGQNYTSDLLEKLSEMVISGEEATATSPRPLKCRSKGKKFSRRRAKELKRLKKNKCLVMKK